VFDSVDDLLAAVPTLNRVVQTCVQEIVLLRAPEDTYDVSHSEPRWANRVFISVPPVSPLQDLRVVEALVHEAMHLNLTNLERCTPLVTDARTLGSPWRAELRPVSGVLHGLYVFCCILLFFQRFGQAARLDSTRTKYVEHRLADIATQIGSINRRSLLEGLTPAGRHVGRRPVSRGVSRAKKA
jgi:HEXXH motif-containing protein